MFCPNCGKQLPDGVGFCKYCGAPTGRASSGQTSPNAGAAGAGIQSAPVYSQQPAASNAQYQQPASPNAQYQQPQQSTAPRKVPKKSSKKLSKKALLIIIAAAVVVIAAVLLVVFLVIIPAAKKGALTNSDGSFTPAILQTSDVSTIESLGQEKGYEVGSQTGSLKSVTLGGDNGGYSLHWYSKSSEYGILDIMALSRTSDSASVMNTIQKMDFFGFETDGSGKVTAAVYESTLDNKEACEKYVDGLDKTESKNFTGSNGVSATVYKSTVGGRDVLGVCVYEPYSGTDGSGTYCMVSAVVYNECSVMDEQTLQDIVDAYNKAQGNNSGSVDVPPISLDALYSLATSYFGNNMH